MCVCILHACHLAVLQVCRKWLTTKLLIYVYTYVCMYMCAMLICWDGLWHVEGIILLKWLFSICQFSVSYHYALQHSIKSEIYTICKYVYTRLWQYIALKFYCYNNHIIVFVILTGTCVCGHRKSVVSVQIGQAAGLIVSDFWQGSNWTQIIHIYVYIYTDISMNLCKAMLILY